MPRINLNEAICWIGVDVELMVLLVMMFRDEYYDYDFNIIAINS